MLGKSKTLGDLYYIKGKQVTNFRIFHNYLVDGEKMFSKWVYYLDATEQDIEAATHRTLLVNEIVLDFDPEKDESFEHLTDRVKKVCYTLKKRKVEFVCYSTGSRGYHIHLFIRDLFFLEKEARRQFRVNIIKFFGAEIQKNSEGTAIALENVPHWKSGKIKQRCAW